MRNTWLWLAAVTFVSLIAGSVLASNGGKPALEVRTDTRSIETGKAMFKEKCSYCHDPAGVRDLGGPSLKGVLKNPELPVSKKPATPENVVNQIRHPYQGMPLFIFSDEELAYMLSYLNTL